MQIASCHKGGHKFRGRRKCLFLTENERLRSCREINQNRCPQVNFMMLGFLHHSVFPECWQRTGENGKKNKKKKKKKKEKNKNRINKLSLQKRRLCPKRGPFGSRGS